MHELSLPHRRAFKYAVRIGLPGTTHRVGCSGGSDKQATAATDIQAASGRTVSKPSRRCSSRIS